MNTAKYLYVNTAKEKSRKVWAMFVLNEDTVWYYILTKRHNSIKYKTLDEIKDMKNMVVFHTKKDLMGYIKEDIKYRTYPAKATDVEVVQGYVTRENNEVWFDTVNFKRYTLKEASKWH